MATNTTRALLDYQADRIEYVLASHRVPVRVHSGDVSPRWVRFLVTPPMGARIATVRNLSEEIALAVGAADVRVGREGESLAVDLPRHDPEPVRLLALLRQVGRMPLLTACIGLTADGRNLLLRMTSPDVAHVLVAGSTGSGKTELIRTLLLSLAITHRQSRLQLALIDPKRRGFLPLSGLPHLVAPVAWDVESSTQLLERLVQEMERRDRAGISSPHIVVAVDELLDLLVVGGKPVETLLTRIAQRGREAGLHLIAGAQKPAASVLGPMLKANFPIRLVGRVGSAEDARVATGVAASGAEKLAGQGDFVAVGSGQITRFQAAWVPAPDWPHLMARM